MAPRGFLFPSHLMPPAIALADERIQKLMLIIGPGSGKSVGLSVVYPAYALGIDPTMTVLAVSASEGLPQGFMHAVMEILDKSPHYRRLFPASRPDKKAGWSTERGLYLTARPSGDPDSSYFAAGITSKQLVGKHGRLLILDDLHDGDNSSSQSACEKVISRYYNTLLGRADPRGARFLLAGRRWSEWDIYGHMIESGDWVGMRLPAERPGESNLYYDVYVPPGLSCCFTEGAAQEVPSDNPKYRQFRAYYGIDPKGQGFYWPSSDTKRQEYFSVKKNRPAEAAAVYQGQPGTRDSGIFLDSDFQTISLGPHQRLFPGLLPPFLRTPSCRVIQAWDTAHDRNPDSDYSVCTTAVVVPCNKWHHGEDPAIFGAADSHYDVYVVDVFRDKLEFGGLMDAVREMAQAWGPSFIAIERITGSIPLIQSLSNTLPITPISIRILGNKRARITVSVAGGTASVQGWLRQGRVFFWEEAPWLTALKREMLDFSGDGNGHDDQVDSISLLIAQAISLGSGAARLPNPESLEPSGVGPPMAADPRLAGLQAIGSLAQAPMAETLRREATNMPGILPSPESTLQFCANCRRRDKATGICEVQKRKTSALETCEVWSWDAGAI